MPKSGWTDGSGLTKVILYVNIFKKQKEAFLE
jgi:hypothetical protein